MNCINEIDILLLSIKVQDLENEIKRLKSKRRYLCKIFNLIRIKVLG